MYDDDDDLTHLWQGAFCDLQSGAAKHITEPSVLLLQTNEWKGLSQITEQTPRTRLHTTWMWHRLGDRIKTDAQQGRSSPRQAEGDAGEQQFNCG